ncbi:hypothetical protein MLD38_003430 [Melastoma candidum]|uniref:Uncharacterized protein n=1 Tax=Melastoma candidum TaxID=119954 RepID=A0ACB9S6F1_9MYRT|nr:hypothetical protein MLD38_003430 [Melastoma candidum]
MEPGGSLPRNAFLLFLTVSCVPSMMFPCASAYRNYTVGDSLGWYDKSMKPAVNYQNWVSGKNFSLGDFLIFNTDTNHSVVQTYNFTTYKACDYADALDNDTLQWSSADPSNTDTHPVTVAVPLVKEGPNYFFSGDYDGDQCRDGQHFRINVTHGQGLPESLKSPQDQAPAPNYPDSGSDDSAPDTNIPSNFDNPTNTTTGDTESGAGSVSGRWVDYVVVLGAGLLVMTQTIS